MAARKQLQVPGFIEYPSIAQTFVDQARSHKKGGKLLKADVLDMAPLVQVEDEGKTGDGVLVKSILNLLNGPKDSVERLAFTQDPSQINNYSSVYRAKLRLIPDTLLKRIAIQDDLVAAIVNTRCQQMAAFGRPRPDRFSNGFVIEPIVGVVEKLTPEKKVELHKRIEAAVRILETCGSSEGIKEKDKCTFSQWLSMSTRNAVVVGRLATEIIQVGTMEDPNAKKFHSFRAIDAGTIYKANPQKEAADSVRKEARHLLEQVKNKKLLPEKFVNDEYAWVQVIDGKPLQAFTSDECVVHNFYPVPDVELDGYPVTPIDTMISAVVTHINITTHNKIYFQTGRATRGMLIIKSDDVDENVVARVKQQFNASINSVNNAWRMPVFAIGSEDELDWEPIDNSSRDMEFQYLTDMNARVIFSAFQISPEEVPGWSYLSRGTNNQALSESNNEYKLEAARDVGIRPLVAQFEDFVNATIFPLIDSYLAKLCRVRLVGLDAETAEKEAVRLQQDMPVHMTYDQVMEKVEKKPIGRAMGGEFPLNPQFQTVLDKYFTVGQIQEFFMGVANASKDPKLSYFRDPFWFQFQQLQMQAQQMQMQAQQQQAQAQQAAAGAGDPGSEQPSGEGVQDSAQPDTGGDSGPANDNGGADGGGDSKQPNDANTENQKNAAMADASAAGQDLTRSIDQAVGLLTKGEDKLPPGKRRLLEQHRKVIRQALDGWEEDLRLASKDIIDAVKKKKD